MLNDHGLGDTIQFVRYLPLMAAAGVETTFVCPARLHRLLSSRIATRFVDAPPDESFDAQIAISSLPRAFRTRLDTVPADSPYLSAEPALVEKWSQRIGSAGFKIGVVWQGNPHPEADRARSMPLVAFAPLARIAGVRLISLQKGFGEEQLASCRPCRSRRSARIRRRPDAFVDAAAAMAHLDLVVTCDTSIAHLAGALGRPVWVALKSDAEWRWMTERPDSPWYPTMRLFRQSRRGAWVELFENMAQELESTIGRLSCADDSDAVLDRRTDRQDHDSAHQGRAHRRPCQARQRAARTRAARSPSTGRGPLERRPRNCLPTTSPR